MPLEVTPPPFGAMRLPYTPQFIPSDAQNSGAPSRATALSHGPASAAASAIIPPIPGGVAGPHQAIPALPDAGYTAPSLRPASIAGGAPAPTNYGVGTRGFPGPASVYGGRSAYAGHRLAGSVYGAGGSVYGGGHSPHFTSPRPPMSMIQSEGWAANSLPAPRRAAAPLLQQHHSESVIAPHAHHHHSGDDHRHHHHHHHHQQPDESDKQSETSYYSRPKARHRRSESFSSDSEVSSPRETHRKRSSSIPHQHHSPSLPPIVHSLSHTYSPVSASPLTRSPLSSPPMSPSHTHRHHSLTIDGREGERGRERLPPSPGPQSERKGGGRSRQPSPTPQRERKEERRSRQPSPGPLPDAERKENRDKEGKGYRQSNLRRDDWARSHDGSARGDDGYDREQDQGKHHHHESGPNSAIPEPVSRQASIKKNERRHHRHLGGSDKEHGQDREHDHHHHHSGTHLAIPGANSEPSECERECHHHQHHHQHHERSDPYYAVSEPEQAPERHHHHRSRPHRTRHSSSSQLPVPAPNLHVPETVPTDSRRRAVSMQLDRPPFAYPGPAAEVYDDGASIAGSGMTFMDGAVGGRTSQYGLPKYPHTPKMDYRRFCVQRGNADVFLD